MKTQEETSTIIKGLIFLLGSEKCIPVKKLKNLETYYLEGCLCGGTLKTNIADYFNFQFIF